MLRLKRDGKLPGLEFPVGSDQRDVHVGAAEVGHFKRLRMHVRHDDGRADAVGDMLQAVVLVVLEGMLLGGVVPEARQQDKEKRGDEVEPQKGVEGAFFEFIHSGILCRGRS